MPRPLVPPAYLRPPKRKLFWVLPIHLSLVPSSPGPCALPEPSAPLLFPFLSHFILFLSNVPFLILVVYMLTYYSPPNQVSLPPHVRSDLFQLSLSYFLSLPHPCTCLTSPPPRLVLHPGILSLRPLMCNQYSISLLTHPPPGAPSHPRVGPAYSAKHVPAHESQ